ncbi:hypothetical protein U4T61_21065, partial [Escherichia coli]|nr:hypothetical protein [Escherichia coli]
EKRVFLVILFTSFSGSLVSRISGAVQFALPGSVLVAFLVFCLNVLWILFPSDFSRCPCRF